MMTLNPQASGDINSGGTILPLTDAIVQSAGLPYDVTFYAISLTGLTAADAMAIQNGAEKVELADDVVTFGGSATINFSGFGITAATEQGLASGTGSAGLFSALTATSFGSTPATTTAGEGDIQNSTFTTDFLTALAAGDPYFLIGAYTQGGGAAESGALVSVLVTCFAAGTRIATPDGEVAVDTLRAGDMVLAGIDGTPRPVRWIGERTLDLRAHPHPQEAAPVRIAAGAFADGVPARDLLLSPEHCVFADGTLIPARRLVNGTTITQLMDLPRVRYFHLELDKHDLLRSEGLLTESYLDTGNRAAFANAGVALLLHPEFSVNAALRCWRTDACAPLADVATAQAVWERLAARARDLGAGADAVAETTTQSEARLWVNGRLVPPVVDTDRLIFALPPGARDSVRLVCRASAPAALRPWEDDRRSLGLCVRGLLAHGSDGTRRIALDDPALAEGWHAAEDGARWTDGNAAIRLPAGAATDLLEVQLRGRASHPVRLQNAAA
jgi:hypothetical protein